jgi:hypothetical protein
MPLSANQEKNPKKKRATLRFSGDAGAHTSSKSLIAFCITRVAAKDPLESPRLKLHSMKRKISSICPARLPALWREGFSVENESSLPYQGVPETINPGCLCIFP